MTALRGNHSPLGALTLGGAATVVGVLPVFLAGAMAVQLTADLNFGLAGLGAAVAIFRATGALTSVHLGRLADRLGSTWSIRLASSVAAIGSLGIAATATSWATLVAWLIFISSANSLAQPAANRLLIRNVRADKLGSAFGVKQSAPPLASMLAGLSVPLIALTFGWRWAYVAAAALSLVVILAAGRRPSAATPVSQDKQRPKLDAGRSIVLLAAAFGLATIASSAIPVFYVDAAAKAGQPVQTAGAILAAASVAAIIVRLTAGILSDRFPSGHLRLCAALLAVGTCGLGLLATSDPSMMAVGVVVGLAGAWGLNGVFWFALVRAHPTTPGAVTGAVAPGGLLGTTIGPIMFGLIADNVTHGAAWLAAACVGLLGVFGMLLGARLLTPDG